MVNKEKIIETIFNVIDEINLEFPEDNRLEKSVDTVLFGKSGKLDSLGLVNFIVATEQHIEENFNVLISLTDEKAMSQKNSPFKTIGTLADYIALLINESSNEEPSLGEPSNE
ncbi:MAG: acyl carrier protein [Candidatus Schekmanbacteria bacterium]|nr:acyl carrier protein [Candidatus Schekmanbacteria bacterium]